MEHSEVAGHAPALRARAILSVGAALCLAAIAIAPAARAASPGPITLAKIGSFDVAPSAFVDSRGTMHVVVVDETGHANVLVYERKPAGSRSFHRVKLPAAPSTVFEPMVYEPSPGQLRLIATGPPNKGAAGSGGYSLVAWSSANDGQSWTPIDTTPFNASLPGGGGISSFTFQASPGGPIASVYGGPTGEALVALRADLSGYDVIGSLSEVPLEFGRAVDGTAYAVTQPGGIDVNRGPDTWPVTIGNAPSIRVSFPACHYATVLVAGRSSAVLVNAGCGKVYARTISPGGTIGALQTLGPGPGATKTDTDVLQPRVDAVADASGNLTVAWMEQSGDWAVATSSTGESWTVSPSLLPVATGVALYVGTSGLGSSARPALTRGTPTWLTDTAPLKLTGSAGILRAIPLNRTYRTPTPPSTSGLPGAVTARFGSVAESVPGTVSYAEFERTGSITFRLKSAFPDVAYVGVQLGRKLAASQTGFVPEFSSVGKVLAPVHLSAGAVRTLRVTLKALPIPGKTGMYVARRGEAIRFIISTRNGYQNVFARLG